MTTSNLLKNLTLWVIGLLIVVLSAFEYWAGHSVISVCIGLLASAVVLPPVRHRLHRGLRYWLSTQASAAIVVVLLIAQVTFTNSGANAIEEQRTAAEQQRLRDITAVRRHEMASTFDTNKAAILSAINDQVLAGKLAEALAESNKYDNADADLNSVKHRISIDLVKKTLKDESGLPLKQRAASYRQLAALEPTNREYSSKAETLGKQLVEEQRVATEKALKHEHFLAQFSQWDGSHRNVEAAIKERMNNPDSYTHVETRFAETPSGGTIYTKFRGTNGFGAVITTTAVATVDSYGNVTSLVF